MSPRRQGRATFVDILDSRFAEGCTEMKAQGIQVFTIAFDVGSVTV